MNTLIIGHPKDEFVGKESTNKRVDKNTNKRKTDGNNIMYGSEEE